MQDALILACEHGDAKEVLNCLSKGAKPDVVNAAGKHPLGAAVWGMNPGVVNKLLEKMGNVSPMTWAECESHNKKHYNNEVYLVENFAPKTFDEWNELLKKIDPNPFIRAYHLQKADEQWHDNDSASWDNLRKYVDDDGVRFVEILRMGRVRLAVTGTEAGFVGYRTQIKQGIESALRPTVGKTY